MSTSDRTLVPRPSQSSKATECSFANPSSPSVIWRYGFTLHIRPEGKEARGFLMQNGIKRLHVKLNHKAVFSFINTSYCQILCGLDRAKYNAMLILAMMVLRRKGPLSHGITHVYKSPQIIVDRMKDVDYDDVLINHYESRNIQHVLRDRFLETPWEPPSTASATS